MLENLLQDSFLFEEGRIDERYAHYFSLAPKPEPGLISAARVTQGPHWAYPVCCLTAITLLALPSRGLTHWWCCQCLSPHNLGWSQPIQEIAELAFSP